MVGMRYPIDVAVVDKDGVVLRVATLRAWTGMTRPRLRASATIEAAAGVMTGWGIVPGSQLAIGWAPKDETNVIDRNSSTQGES